MLVVQRRERVVSQLLGREHERPAGMKVAVNAKEIVENGAYFSIPPEGRPAEVRATARNTILSRTLLEQPANLRYVQYKSLRANQQ